MGKGYNTVNMASATGNCLHLWGLRASGGSEYRCPACGEMMGLEGVARWVREAERVRDESYSQVKGDGYGDIVREELQMEVYRRRRVMYDLQSVPRAATARPEMILIVYDARSASYECRIFYKEPRLVGVVEQLSVAAKWRTILDLRTDPNPIVRLTSEKVEEFHVLRRKFSDEGAPAPSRRVFYANEL